MHLYHLRDATYFITSHNLLMETMGTIAASGGWSEDVSWGLWVISHLFVVMFHQPGAGMSQRPFDQHANSYNSVKNFFLSWATSKSDKPVPEFCPIAIYCHQTLTFFSFQMLVSYITGQSFTAVLHSKKSCVRLGAFESLCQCSSNQRQTWKKKGLYSAIKYSSNRLAPESKSNSSSAFDLSGEKSNNSTSIFRRFNPQMAWPW